ncbi:farnesyl pyrophosphate synthase [Gigaspora margarita]|uniref:Farnesyl pyrophosphate synthase n=1 Tax=Gigaspora margarita TaxID=4874 RepID=A0A8H3X1Y0_GIGMA|nr:farnesyl pyrophosphate synthase [Gigaspora margarita]
MASSNAKALAKKEFEDVFAILTEEFLKEVNSRKLPQEAFEWIKKNIHHNVLGGKMNRGMSVVDSIKILKGGEASNDELFKARVLGWCVEWLQAFFLVADDIMDSSITRRGNPCWYKMEGVGTIAINDSFILESSVYFFLKKYFRQEPYYVDLLELFHEVTLDTELGQLIDLITAPEDNVDLNRFSMEKYKYIVLYKTAFYSFYLPVALAMHMAGIKNELAFQKAKDILLPLGEYFQIQDDYLDCFGDPNVIGKIGTDIEDNKCSWCINQALMTASPEQRKLLDKHYGKKNPEDVSIIKQVYKDLNLEELYREYEENSFTILTELISQLDENIIKKDIFLEYMNKIYKRTK